MKTVNMHEAKTHLSRLVDEAVKGEPFVIARAGKPLVRVSLIGAAPAKRTGFLKGHVDCPDDFISMGEDELTALFDGSDDSAGS